MNYGCIFVAMLILVSFCEINGADKKGKKKKAVADLTDAEVEKLYDEWEENDPEKLPEDELPPHLRKPAPINLDFNNLKNAQALSKKGKPLMMIVTVNGNPTRQESEQITSLWQSSLFNANYELTRYMYEDNSAIFMINDGALSYEIKDFLIKQERCLDVTIDKEVFKGLHNKKQEEEESENKKTDL